jgi:hypothetical protein
MDRIFTRGGDPGPTSSTVGVALAVGMTVLLAACLGGAGGGGAGTTVDGATPTTVGAEDTTQAPDAEFDVQQQVRFYEGGGVANLTTVDLTHAGGSTLAVDRVTVSIAGNESVWGLEKARTDDEPSQWDHAQPVPDVRSGSAGGATAEYASGDTWSMYGTDGPNLEYVASGEQFVAYWTHPNAQFAELKQFPFPGGEAKHRLTPLESGDEVQISWTAASGGETQTLFSYTVQ